MSNLERQRILREAGSRPAEAEKQSSAAEAKEALAEERAADAGQGPESEADAARPLAEDPGGPPRPRR